MGKWTEEDIRHMKTALELAAKAVDMTYPNPMVGAVIVKDGRVIGKGYHRKAGSRHAEIEAIKDAGREVKGAGIYVSLEPCAHHGKTPPCTEALIKSGIEQVTIAARDPNPLTAGRGIRKLRGAGIKVRTGLLGREAIELNRKFNKYITRKIPYVTIKLAQSLDGKIAARDGTSKWISSVFSRGYVKKIREKFDAILIGSGTLIKDDPFLLDGQRKGYNVIRTVVDTKLRISLSSNLVRTAEDAPLLVVTTELAPVKKVERMRKIRGVDVAVLKSEKGRVGIRSLLKELGRRDVVNLLVEGGGEMAGSFVDEGAVDEFLFFIAPKIIGGDFSSVKGRGAKNIKNAMELEDREVCFMGDDIVVRGKVKPGA